MKAALQLLHLPTLVYRINVYTCLSFWHFFSILHALISTLNSLYTILQNIINGCSKWEFWQHYINWQVSKLVCGSHLKQCAKASCQWSEDTKYEPWVRHFIDFNLILTLFSKLSGLATPELETSENFWSYISNQCSK